MGLFSARKRGNEAFRERAKMRRQAQQTAASQPKPAPEPTPAHPNPEPPTAAGVPYLPSDKVGSDDVTDTPDVTTLADGGIVESPTPVLGEQHAERPLGDLREVAERAASASTRSGTHPGPRGGEHMQPLGTAAAKSMQGCTCGPGEGCSREDCGGTPLPDTDTDAKPFGAAELADSLRVPREWLTDVGIEPKTEAAKPDAMTGVSETYATVDEDKALQTTEPKRSRGRPRPQETIDRDEAVHGLLLAQPEGISKAEIANVLREKEQQVYSSLRQLSKESRAETRHVKDVGYRWFATSLAEPLSLVTCENTIHHPRVDGPGTGVYYGIHQHDERMTWARTIRSRTPKARNAFARSSGSGRTRRRFAAQPGTGTATASADCVKLGKRSSASKTATSDRTRQPIDGESDATGSATAAKIG